MSFLPDQTRAIHNAHRKASIYRVMMGGQTNVTSRASADYWTRSLPTRHSERSVNRHTRPPSGC
jgi:hypothetical protein